MSWSPLRLGGISFVGPHRSPASLEFQQGLNVVRGASDTGKSFLVEAIDFLLGAKSNSRDNSLRDIPQRDGYDRARLILRARDDIFLTLQRSTNGGNFTCFEGTWLTNEPDVAGMSLAANHKHGNRETLSGYLLYLIGLEDKYAQKNQTRGEVQSLSFRNLVRLVLIQEDDIIKKRSPILSGRNTNATAEYSVFKLLLTGVDASALAEQARLENERVKVRQNNRAKLEFVEELIQEQRAELENIQITRTQAEEQISSLEFYLQRQQDIISQVQQDLNSRIERRREILGTRESLTSRLNEIESLLSRFSLLQEHYHIDIERLASIEESGSLLVHLERTSCPLCGALPNDQHKVEMCDGDIENIVNAAAAEIAKVQQLSEELEQTEADLRAEAEELINQRVQVEPELQSLNQEIQEINSPLSDAQNTLSELVQQSSEMQRIVDLFCRVEQMQRRRDSLLSEINASSTNANARIELSTSVLDDFAKMTQNLLQEWNFPGADRVSFDEKKRDLLIGGQPRTSRGKGLRAITHAAMTIGLMDFCRERNLSHPGFLVLDSPLLAYWQPESSEDKAILEGVGLRENFYEYLANHYSDSQIIIIENENPPNNIEGKISLTNFTGNPNEGRFGFFPITENYL
ncbi:MAG: hypothetical protein AAGD25_28805 [Cyanobacteria bacterium P01_F01_bin.150]